MEIHEKDEFGWVGASYEGYIVDIDDAEMSEMLGLLFATGEIMMVNSPLIFVNCSDVFAWGCSDGEPITVDEIPGLFKLVIADDVWGSTIWCCIKRNEQPQDPVKNAMKNKGLWDEVLEALPLNKFSTKLKERRKNEN